jgi:hypothetical protein
MLKVLGCGSYDWGLAPLELIKVSSRGLRGDDLRAFVKRAGHSFLESLDTVRPGEVPVHLIAVGASESYGPNRNGDGFTRATCRACHDTFAKHAHFFRDHSNKADSLRYGRVVKSAFHEPMDRIELLVGLYATKAAAALGGGRLGRVADKELEKLAAGKDLGVSMACRVDHDVCVFCKNAARHRGEYCDDRPVKLARRTVPSCSGFGCAHGLTKVARDGRIQYVDNPEPLYFDISHVYKPAERIAYALGTLEKAAAATVMGGAALAEALGLTAPTSILLDPARPDGALRKLAVELAALEREPVRPALLAAATPGVRPPLEPPPAGYKAAHVFRALRDEHVALSLEEFLTVALDKEAAAEVLPDVAPRLVGVFARLAEDPGPLDGPYGGSAALPPPPVRAWAQKQACGRSAEAAAIVKRAELAAIRGLAVPRPSRPSDGPAYPAAEKIAREYGRYQLALLAAGESENPREFVLTRAFLVNQNRLA